MHLQTINPMRFQLAMIEMPTAEAPSPVTVAAPTAAATDFVDAKSRRVHELLTAGGMIYSRELSRLIWGSATYVRRDRLHIIMRCLKDPTLECGPPPCAYGPYRSCQTGLAAEMKRLSGGFMAHGHGRRLFSVWPFSISQSQQQQPRLHAVHNSTSPKQPPPPPPRSRLHAVPHTKPLRVFFPCPTNAIFIPFLHFGKSVTTKRNRTLDREGHDLTIPATHARRAANFGEADVYIARTSCLRTFDSAARAFYFASDRLFIDEYGGDHPQDYAAFPLSNTTMLKLTEWRTAYPRPRLILSNCRSPHFQVDRDVCFPIADGFPTSATHTCNGPQTPDSPTKYLATFKGMFQHGGPGAVRQLMPFFHAPERGVVSVGRCRVRGAGPNMSAMMAKTETTWLYPAQWCADRQTEYETYDYCDLLNTTYALCPDGRSDATMRFAEVFRRGIIPVALHADKDATGAPLPFHRTLPWSRCVIVLYLPFQQKDVWRALNRPEGEVRGRRHACTELFHTYFGTADRAMNTVLDELSAAILEPPKYKTPLVNEEVLTTMTGMRRHPAMHGLMW